MFMSDWVSSSIPPISDVFNEDGCSCLVPWKDNKRITGQNGFGINTRIPKLKERTDSYKTLWISDSLVIFTVWWSDLPIFGSVISSFLSEREIMSWVEVAVIFAGLLNTTSAVGYFWQMMMMMTSVASNQPSYPSDITELPEISTSDSDDKSTWPRSDAIKAPGSDGRLASGVSGTVLSLMKKNKKHFHFSVHKNHSL